MCHDKITMDNENKERAMIFLLGIREMSWRK